MATPDRVTDYLGEILKRKRREIARRRAHARPMDRSAEPASGAEALTRLRRASGAPPSVIAEVKFCSPSAGEIRRWSPGEAVRVARSYERGGASAISVLADGPGFGGSPLMVRRVARAVKAPVLFKGFVLDPVQVDLAYDAGASMVLLLVRALNDETLNTLIARIMDLGMEPVVEAADEPEVERALATGATIVGVNARDLRTFRVDKDEARRLVDLVPRDRISVFMSGVRSSEDLAAAGAGRADAVLVGEGLMRQENPGERLAHWLSAW